MNRTDIMNRMDLHAEWTSMPNGPPCRMDLHVGTTLGIGLTAELLALARTRSWALPAAAFIAAAFGVPPLIWNDPESRRGQGAPDQ